MNQRFYGENNRNLVEILQEMQSSLNGVLELKRDINQIAIKHGAWKQSPILNFFHIFKFAKMESLSIKTKEAKFPSNAFFKFTSNKLKKPLWKPNNSHFSHDKLQYSSLKSMAQ